LKAYIVQQLNRYFSIVNKKSQKYIEDTLQESNDDDVSIVFFSRAELNFRHGGKVNLIMYDVWWTEEPVPVWFEVPVVRHHAQDLQELHLQIFKNSKGTVSRDEYF